MTLPTTSTSTPATPASAFDPGAFAEWLTEQLRIKRVTQRQLAERAGVDHSTISRLMRGDRIPSMRTADRLARGLREPLFSGAPVAVNPVAKVEHALRADGTLSESQIRKVLDTYLAIRHRNQTVSTAASRAFVAASGVTATIARR